MYILNKTKSGLKKIKSYYLYYTRSYKYADNLYPGTFLSRSSKVSKTLLNPAPEIIYTFWTGDNELTPNRKKGLESLRKNTEVEVKLITQKNLDKYILKDYPLHKAYEYLSYVHRADYLRCYFMLHYGGGYADVKPFNHSWKKAFEKLNNDSEKWVIGYQELGAWGVPVVQGKLGKDIKTYYLYLLGIISFVFKPYSPIAQEWMDELNLRLDENYEVLKRNPAIDPFGTNNNYPIPWSYILGQILHPLFLKYHDKTIKTKKLIPVLKNYR